MAGNSNGYFTRRCLQIARELEWRPRPNIGADVSLSYKKSDLSCGLCAFYKRGAGCTEPVCCCAEERAAAGY